MTCPWESLTRAPAEFCEASICGWIRQPANTWSNVGFLVVGVVILRRARKTEARHLSGLGYIVLATAFGSAFFHASETLLGRFLDWAGMYLGASYMLSVNVRRWLRWPRGRIRVLFWANFLVLMALMTPQALRAPSTYYMLEMSFCCVTVEAFLFIRDRRTTNYTWLVRYWTVFLVAYGLWHLDVRRVLCDPGNHWISGHALWHLLDAVALAFLFEFYRQFRVLGFDVSALAETDNAS